MVAFELYGGGWMKVEVGGKGEGEWVRINIRRIDFVVLLVAVTVLVEFVFCYLGGNGLCRLCTFRHHDKFKKSARKGRSKKSNSDSNLKKVSVQIIWRIDRHKIWCTSSQLTNGIQLIIVTCCWLKLGRSGLIFVPRPGEVTVGIALERWSNRCSMHLRS